MLSPGGDAAQCSCPSMGVYGSPIPLSDAFLSLSMLSKLCTLVEFQGRSPQVAAWLDEPWTVMLLPHGLALIPSGTPTRHVPASFKRETKAAPRVQLARTV